MFKNTFFIAGTDTGVGKTLVSTIMLEAAKARGMSAFGLKPVAAGAEKEGNSWVNEDAQLLRKHSSVELPYEQVNPVLLHGAKAPHIAAEEEGRRVDIERLEGVCRGALMNKADFRVIEGAGGWRVPVNRRQMLSQLPKSLQIPVVLVVGLRLGCINHALLTAEAIINDGLKLAAWVANTIDPTMLSTEENIEALTGLLPAPCLGVVPWEPAAKVELLASNIDLNPLQLQ